MSASAPTNRLARFVADTTQRGRLVVQPRMGLASVDAMQDGLRAVREADVCSVGTITIDSYTRVGDYRAAEKAVAESTELNGFPLVAHGALATDSMVEGLVCDDFPVQVRHGTALPDAIVRILVDTRIDATEGGPVSYTLPYGRTPLEDAVASWGRCCRLLAAQEAVGVTWHLETFGGCILGQLSPPELLIAISVLEAIFFVRHGIRTVSVSYAQQTNRGQDIEALAALRRLADEYLMSIDWHIVVYTWMGLFPRTRLGAKRLIEDSAVLAVQSGAARLLVKTPTEAEQLPTVAENVNALKTAAGAARAARSTLPVPAGDTGLYANARRLMEQVLNDGDDIGAAIVRAFRSGRLDVPYCLHPDNHNRARSYVDRTGRVGWLDPGGMPVEVDVASRRQPSPTAAELSQMLSYVRDRFDASTAGTIGTPSVPFRKRNGL